MPCLQPSGLSRGGGACQQLPVQTSDRRNSPGGSDPRCTWTSTDCTEGYYSVQEAPRRGWPSKEGGRPDGGSFSDEGGPFPRGYRYCPECRGGDGEEKRRRDDKAARVAEEHEEHPGAIWTDGPRLEAGPVGIASCYIDGGQRPHCTTSYTTDEHHGGTDPEARDSRAGHTAAEEGPHYSSIHKVLGHLITLAHATLVCVYRSP